MGYRLCHSTTRVDIHCPRLGAVADRAALTGRSAATVASFRLRHLESVEESINQRDGLVVAAGGAEALLEYQGAADRRDDDRERGRREFFGVEVVLADDEIQSGDLLFAPALGPGRDFRPDLLAVIGKSHELQQQS